MHCRRRRRRGCARVRRAARNPLREIGKERLGSFPLGGIDTSGSVKLRAVMSRLSPGLPGTMTGPETPPLSNPSLVSSTRLPFGAGILELWQP